MRLLELAGSFHKFSSFMREYVIAFQVRLERNEFLSLRLAEWAFIRRLALAGPAADLADLSCLSIISTLYSGLGRVVHLLDLVGLASDGGLQVVHCLAQFSQHLEVIEGVHLLGVGDGLEERLACVILCIYVSLLDLFSWLWRSIFPVHVNDFRSKSSSSRRSVWSETFTSCSMSLATGLVRSLSLSRIAPMMRPVRNTNFR